VAPSCLAEATQPTHSAIGRTSSPKAHANRLDEFLLIVDALPVLGRNAPQPGVGLVINFSQVAQARCVAACARRFKVSDKAFCRQGVLHSAECSL
jgi:hypothetical protein